MPDYLISVPLETMTEDHRLVMICGLTAIALITVIIAISFATGWRRFVLMASGTVFVATGIFALSPLAVTTEPITEQQIHTALKTAWPTLTAQVPLDTATAVQLYPGTLNSMNCQVVVTVTDQWSALVRCAGRDIPVAPGT